MCFTRATYITEEPDAVVPQVRICMGAVQVTGRSTMTGCKGKNMDEFINLIIVVVTGVIAFTVTYKILPFKLFTDKKPSIALFPKYIVTYNTSISDIEKNLDNLQFKKVDVNTFSRGKIYGDFSAKAIKITVKINREISQIKVYASFFGIAFDTGDIWQLTSDIVNA